MIEEDFDENDEEEDDEDDQRKGRGRKERRGQTDKNQSIMISTQEKAKDS